MRLMPPVRGVPQHRVLGEAVIVVGVAAAEGVAGLDAPPELSTR